MVPRAQCRQIAPCQWEIPATTRTGMKVPARVFAREDMLEGILGARSPEQLMSVAALPGIGKVAATRWPDGILSPVGIRYDIHCGAGLLWPLPYRDALPPRLAGRGGEFLPGTAEPGDMLRVGAGRAIKNGPGDPRDLERSGAGGRPDKADPAAVWGRAKKKGFGLLRTLGPGNHVGKLGWVQVLYAETTAAVFGLRDQQVAALIHSGSQDLAQQVATDYLKRMMEVMTGYGTHPVDRKLTGVPLSAPGDPPCVNARAAAANFAWSNREFICDALRQARQKVFRQSGKSIRLLYGVAHTIVTIEEHPVDGSPVKRIIRRKAATRTFGPGQHLPTRYRPTGQPVWTPGSMGSASPILAGMQRGMEIAFGSCCHVAGRRLSRHAAKKQISGPALLARLCREQGIVVCAGSLSGIARKEAWLRPPAGIKADSVRIPKKGNKTNAFKLRNDP